MRICLYGAASFSIDNKYIEKVEELGLQMTKRGHSLVFGGGANGLMGAAARGVKKGNGYILGVIPTFFDDEKIEGVYPKCDKLIETKTMRERKQIMEDNADAFIVTPGGVGTFEEFFEILTSKQLCRHNKPIVLYNIDDYYSELAVMMKAAVEKKFIRRDCLNLYKVTDNLEELFSYLEGPQPIRTVKDLKEG